MLIDLLKNLLGLVASREAEVAAKYQDKIAELEATIAAMQTKDDDEIAAVTAAIEELKGLPSTPAADAIAEVVIESEEIETPAAVEEATEVINSTDPTPVEVTDAAIDAVVDAVDNEV
jgi:hypothetical protein